MKNKNFEHINYIINQNISQINDYIKQNTKIKKPIDPESDKDLAFRLNFKYNIGDYAWYIPEKIDNVQPFIAIRCIIVDVCKDNEVTEYAIDEPVKHTISPLKLYPDVTLCFNALERTFYNSIKEYIMKNISTFDLNCNFDFDRNFDFDKKTLYENFQYDYSDLRSWRYHVNNHKHPENNILTVKKQKLIDWYNIEDFFDFKLIYCDT